MLSRPRKPPSNTFLPKRSLRSPPGEGQARAVKRRFELKLQVRLAAQGLFAPPQHFPLFCAKEEFRQMRGPGDYVSEIPLRKQASGLGVQVGGRRHQVQSALGEVGIYDEVGARGMPGPAAYQGYPTCQAWR